MEIVTFQPHRLNSVLEFLARQFPDAPLKADGAYFQWRFGENPLGSSLSSYRLAVDQDTVLGQMGALRDRIQVNGAWHDCVWMVDLMLAHEYRGGLAPLRLFQSFMEQERLVLTTGAARHMLPMFQALGWNRRRIALTYYLPLRPGRLVKMAAELGRVPRWAQWAGPGLWASDRVMPSMYRWVSGWSRFRSDRVIVETLDEFATELDGPIQELVSAMGVTNYRSSALLEWKFSQRPLGQHTAWIARDRENGRVRGYLAAKLMRRQHVASWLEIVDYLAAPGDTTAFTSLVAKAYRMALDFKVDFARLRLSCPQHTVPLRPPWWIHRTTPISDEVFFYTKDAGLRDQLAQAPWHLTTLASDRTDNGRDEWPGGEANRSR